MIVFRRHYTSSSNKHRHDVATPTLFPFSTCTMSDDASASIIASVDALFGEDIISANNVCRPISVSKPRSLKQLKQICHLGVSSQLRCSVWIVSVMRVVNPHLPIAEVEAYGTVSLQANIESTWNHALHATFANGIDREGVDAPNFGLQQPVLDQLIQSDYRHWNPSCSAGSNSIPAKGVRSLTGILCAVHQVLGIEYCPLLPDISELFTSSMHRMHHCIPIYIYLILRSCNTIDTHARKLCICNSSRGDQRFVSFPSLVAKGVLLMVQDIFIFCRKIFSSDVQDHGEMRCPRSAFGPGSNIQEIFHNTSETRGKQILRSS